MVTWGTSPQDALADHRARARSGRVPTRRGARAWSARSRTWASSPGTPLDGRRRSTACSSARAPTAGSRTCARRRAVAQGRGAPWCRRWIVPGSGLSSGRPRPKGLDRVFIDAGFEWREAGCSMCVGMNGETVARGRARGLHLQPQLRGTPGPGRAHASDVSPRWRPPPRSPASSPTCARWRAEDVQAVHALDRRRRADRPAERRHRPRSSRRAFCARPRSAPATADFLFHDVRFDADGAESPEFVLNQPAFRAREDPGRRGELRLRLLARGARCGRSRPPASAR